MKLYCRVNCVKIILFEVLMIWTWTIISARYGKSFLLGDWVKQQHNLCSHLWQLSMTGTKYQLGMLRAKYQQSMLRAKYQLSVPGTKWRSHTQNTLKWAQFPLHLWLISELKCNVLNSELNWFTTTMLGIHFPYWYLGWVLDWTKQFLRHAEYVINMKRAKIRLKIVGFNPKLTLDKSEWNERWFALKFHSHRTR